MSQESKKECDKHTESHHAWRDIGKETEGLKNTEMRK